MKPKNPSIVPKVLKEGIESRDDMYPKEAR